MADEKEAAQSRQAALEDQKEAQSSKGSIRRVSVFMGSITAIMLVPLLMKLGYMD